MRLDSWNHELDIALTRASHEISGLAGDIAVFVEQLTLVEKSLLAGLGLITLVYLFMPGGRGEASGSGKAFAGILLLFVAAGVFGGLVLAGHISL
jgi:hypothetical protein